MIRRATILLLFTLTPVTLADEVSSYAQFSPAYEPLVESGSQRVLPAPIANGTVRANDGVHLASHDQADDLPPAVPEQTVSPANTELLETPPQQVAATPPSDNARLLRRRDSSTREESEQQDEEPQANSPVALLNSDAATTALAATALVVGLFLVCAWVLKRGMPKSSRLLPREAVEILGRCPLGNKQFAHLLHVGNKVILVNVTANGAETLVEVDDPNEVVRILGACAASGPGSTSKEFDAIFQQFAKEPAPKGFLGEESATYSAAASAYSQSAQGGRHG